MNLNTLDDLDKIEHTTMTIDEPLTETEKGRYLDRALDRLMILENKNAYQIAQIEHSFANHSMRQSNIVSELKHTMKRISTAITLKVEEVAQVINHVRNKDD